MKNTEVIFKSHLQSPIPYHTYSISKAGLHIGGNPISSNFTWRNCQRVARGIIRAWARDLVAGHDSAQLCAILHQWAKDWSSNNDGANTYNGELLRLKDMLSSLIDIRLEHKAYFRQTYGSRDGSVIFHLSREIVDAVGYCLNRMALKPRVQLEIESLPNGVEIYRMLLEGSK